LIALFITALFAFLLMHRYSCDIYENKANRQLYCSPWRDAALLGIIGSARYSEEVNVSCPLMNQKRGYSLPTRALRSRMKKIPFNVVVEQGRLFTPACNNYCIDYSKE
jgi:hypothetical protein